MVRAYLDSSAYIKEFSKEKGSQVIEKIFSAYEKGNVDLVSSQWTVGESIAAIDRKHRRGEITQDELQETVDAVIRRSYEFSQKENFTIVPVKPELVTASFRYITAHHVSADDALHIFSAVVGLGEIFIAADSYLIQAVRKEGFEGYNVEDEKDAQTLLNRLRV